MRPNIALCLIAIIGASTVACGDGNAATTAPTVTVAGTYVLQKIEDGVIPVEIFNGSASDATTGEWYDDFIVTIDTGTLELDPRGHYNSKFVYSLVLDGVAENRTITAQGTYEVSGKQVVLTRGDDLDDRTEGTIENGQVTLALTLMGGTANKPYVFRR